MARQRLSDAQAEARLLTGWLHVMALWGFAVAQPLFDVLSRHAEFFTIRRSHPLDILLLVILVSLVLPGSICLLLEVVGRASARLRFLLFCTALGALMTATVLSPIHRMSVLGGATSTAVAVAIGVAFAIAYGAIRGVRAFLTPLSLAALVFPLLFVLGSPIRGFIFDASETMGTAVAKRPAGVGVDVPVVLLVLDELPLASLIDREGNVDAQSYPNFAALADGAHWFRNASAVNAWTHLSVPSLLTGRLPSEDLLPTADDYPDSLFQILADTHEIINFESITSLGPQTEGQWVVPFRNRMASLFSDVSVVYMHVLLPVSLADWLPPVDQSWGQFGGAKEDGPHKNYLKDRTRRFAEFLDAVVPTDRPPFLFMHLELPHGPLRYLPSGREYGRTFEPYPTQWGDDEEAVARFQQRHLFQVVFADELLGQLLQRLRRVGLYDRSLLIVTSDHGASFRTLGNRRKPTDENFAEILGVPLFVKLPGQTSGVIDDRNAELIDVVPTIADILDVETSWKMDGQTLIGGELPAKSGKRISVGIGDWRRYPLDDYKAALASAVELKIQRFGDPGESLFRIGPHSGLIGRAIADLKLRSPAPLEVELDQASEYLDVDLSGRFAPVYITGRVRSDDVSKGSVALAISVNGVVQAVTRIVLKDGAGKIGVVVPEDSFVSGANRVQVFSVLERDGAVALAPSGVAAAPSYSLDSQDETITLVSSNGERIPVVPGAVSGGLDSVYERNESIAILGWAADVKGKRPCVRVVLFLEGDFLTSTSTFTARPGVGKHLKIPSLVDVGVSIDLPRSISGYARGARYRMFAISSSGNASELRGFTIP